MLGSKIESEGRWFQLGGVPSALAFTLFRPVNSRVTFFWHLELCSDVRAKPNSAWTQVLDRLSGLSSSPAVYSYFSIGEKMPVYARPVKWDMKDEREHPLILECDQPGCEYKVSHTGPEEKAWAQLEYHQRGDNCPMRLLHYKQKR